ncbi:MAG: hypothetical protein REH83_04765, partial [Rickettsiella sp.]|nr:hypothetical protein [Rickettsiella sp.]
LVLKTRGTARNIHHHYNRIQDGYDEIREKLDKIETLLATAIEKYENYPNDQTYPGENNYVNPSSSNSLETTTFFGLFRSKRDKSTAANAGLLQQEHNFKP